MTKLSSVLFAILQLILINAIRLWCVLVTVTGGVILIMLCMSAGLLSAVIQQYQQCVECYERSDAPTHGTYNNDTSDAVKSVNPVKVVPDLSVNKDVAWQFTNQLQDVQRSSIVDQDYSFDCDDSDESTLCGSAITVIATDSYCSTLVPRTEEKSDVADLTEFEEYDAGKAEEEDSTITSEDRLTLLPEKIDRLDTAINTETSNVAELIESEETIGVTVDKFTPTDFSSDSLVKVRHVETTYLDELIAAERETTYEQQATLQLGRVYLGPASTSAKKETLLRDLPSQIGDGITTTADTVAEIDSGNLVRKERRSFKERLSRWRSNSCRFIWNLLTECTSLQPTD